MPDYIERERQRQRQAGSANEEHLDWLAQQHTELAVHSELLRQQNATLERIARHTGLMYVLTIIGLVATVMWVLYILVLLAGSA